jgi:hypothetical protein
MGMGDPDLITSEPTYHTAEMVRALNAAEPLAWPRYECVYGELIVSPSLGNWHQWIAQQLFLRLHAYVEASRLAATPYMAPADISWGRSDVTVQPDVFVTPRDMARCVPRGCLDAHPPPVARGRGPEPEQWLGRSLPEAAALPGAPRTAVLDHRARDEDR